MRQGQNWHNLTTEEAFRALDSSQNGLSETEAKARLYRYGPNQLQEKTFGVIPVYAGISCRRYNL